MEDFTSAKRPRDDSEESPESPEVKRLRDDLFCDILEDVADAGERDPAVQDLASVMKSLEDEIGLTTKPTVVTEQQVVESGQPDLGFLLEASDDELGLPPAALSSSEGDVEVVEAGGEPEDGGYGSQIWGFDDDVFDGGMGFGMRVEERDAGGDDGVLFDEGLFDYSDVACGPSDLVDFPWRAESLPAV
ncbi:hypothetical protein J5N97_027856 [Dioscorea zingiberensis]|uniref:Uncharacterized protein n=1 Tax=Dioscorea zingiberensis TaxID=325984 RepID=A0A9D5H4C5_9LILI|nr:hypothetical protein J5N97_027856 [Dioscorea zingiberensis]